MSTTALVTIPARVKRGEAFEIRATIGHPMETGHRSDVDGRVLPQNVIRRFECKFEGNTVFSAELHAAIAANPYIAFFAAAEKSGTFSFEWAGDQNFLHRETKTIAVE
jgi:sulfur-oxidizing protein SoxZ